MFFDLIFFIYLTVFKARPSAFLKNFNRVVMHFPYYVAGANANLPDVYFSERKVNHTKPLQPQPSKSPECVHATKILYVEAKILLQDIKILSHFYIIL